jgi:hypothetical protein
MGEDFLDFIAIAFFALNVAVIGYLALIYSGRKEDDD